MNFERVTVHCVDKLVHRVCWSFSCARTSVKWLFIIYSINLLDRLLSNKSSSCYCYNPGCFPGCSSSVTQSVNKETGWSCFTTGVQNLPWSIMLNIIYVNQMRSRDRENPKINKYLWTFDNTRMLYKSIAPDRARIPRKKCFVLKVIYLEAIGSLGRNLVCRMC